MRRSPFFHPAIDAVDLVALELVWKNKFVIVGNPPVGRPWSILALTVGAGHYGAQRRNRRQSAGSSIEAALHGARKGELTAVLHRIIGAESVRSGIFAFTVSRPSAEGNLCGTFSADL